MNLWNIKRRLASMSHRVRPDKVFVSALRCELQNKGYLPVQHFSHLYLWWKRALATSSLVVLSLVGTGTYAYASPNVLPDHVLYPVRTTLERVQLNVAYSETAKAKVQSRLISRHLKSLERSVTAVKRTDDSNMDDQDVIQEDVHDVVALEQQILSEMIEDKGLFNEEEGVQLNEALKEQAHRVQQRLELMKPARQNKR